MNEVPKTNPTAIVALVASLLGFTCLWGIGGLAAIVLGVIALREIDRADGREQGRAFAGVAVALGALNLVVLIVGGVGLALWARSSVSAAPTRTPAPATAPRPAPPSMLPPGHPEIPSPAEPGAPGRSNRAFGTRDARVGKVHLVDLNPGSGTLGPALEAQRREAGLAHEKLVLFLVSPGCQPCNGVSLALSDPRMQRALAEVRLVRVDVSDYAAELSTLRIPIETVPGFALLDDGGKIADYVHGGEWDADVAANIAPVLGAFVRGKYDKRRHPFRGPSRPDETAL